MPRKKTPTKKEKEPEDAFEEVPAVRMMAPAISGKKFLLQYVDLQNNAKEVPCSKKLYAAVDEDMLHTNYRVTFKLHKNINSGVVEYITTVPKDLYKSYEMEYEEEMKVPQKDVYTAPGD